MFEPTASSCRPGGACSWAAFVLDQVLSERELVIETPPPPPPAPPLPKPGLTHHGSSAAGSSGCRVTTAPDRGISVSVTAAGCWFVKSFIFTLLLHLCGDSSSSSSLRGLLFPDVHSSCGVTGRKIWRCGRAGRR